MNLTIDQAKSYFNPKPAITNAERVQVRFLKRYGAFVRQESRDSIKKRKSASLPGQAPHGHTGTLKKNIFFVVDREQMDVWIFPALLPRKRQYDNPATLEFGGRSRITKPRVRYKTRAGRFINPRKEKVPKSAKRVVVKPGAYAVHERPFMAPAKRRVDPQVSGIWAYARN